METPSPRWLWIPSPRATLLLALALGVLVGAVCLHNYARPRRSAFGYVEQVTGGEITCDAAWWMPRWVARRCRWILPVDSILLGDRAPPDLARLVALCEARQIGLSRHHLGEDDLVAIGRFRRLKVLYLDETTLTAAGLAPLRDCHQLEELSCFGTAITDAELAHLAGLPLRKLNLNSTSVTSAGLRYLEAAPLTELSLAETEVDDAGLAHVANMKSLRWLNLRRTRITDEGLAQLANLPLEELNLNSTSVTHVGLSACDRMPLRSLALCGTRISSEVVPILCRIKTLKVVTVTNRRLAHEEMQLLEAGGMRVMTLDLKTDAGHARSATLAGAERSRPVCDVVGSQSANRRNAAKGWF